jgi:hypothetical protein
MDYTVVCKIGFPSNACKKLCPASSYKDLHKRLSKFGGAKLNFPLRIGEATPRGDILSTTSCSEFNMRWGMFKQSRQRSTITLGLEIDGGRLLTFWSICRDRIAQPSEIRLTGILCVLGTLSFDCTIGRLATHQPLRLSAASVAAQTRVQLKS